MKQDTSEKKSKNETLSIASQMLLDQIEVTNQASYLNTNQLPSRRTRKVGARQNHLEYVESAHSRNPIEAQPTFGVKGTEALFKSRNATPRLMESSKTSQRVNETGKISIAQTPGNGPEDKSYISSPREVDQLQKK
jgi:hypothetical protein